jgi:hypothetical protein
VTTERSWRLIAVETDATPYPLTDDLRNATADRLEEIVGPGAAQLAVDALAGRAKGGAPTLESWAAHLAALAESEGRAAAAMLLLPSGNMFPELGAGACGSAPPHPYCELAADLREIAADDPAPLAVMEIAVAERAGGPSAAIEAMQRAQSSAHRDHPALGASFALAVMRFDQDALAQATAAGLPTDVEALQARAVMELPYNPAYWTDIGDRYAAGYQADVAFLFYDIAFSLPMPSAVANNQALASKRQVFGRIQADFPDASLPR